jgi:putative (di)nucleoside polyphosphate hydrolase
MAKNEEPQKVRAQVGALIVNNKDEILIVQNQGYPVDLWDFVKGGIHEGEDLLTALKREIKEELGPAFEYEIVGISGWKYVYTWPKEMQIEKQLLGAARISFWVKHLKGDITIDSEELLNYKWVPLKDLENFLTAGSWVKNDAKQIIFDWENSKQ